MVLMYDYDVLSHWVSEHPKCQDVKITVIKLRGERITVLVSQHKPRSLGTGIWKLLSSGCRVSYGRSADPAFREALALWKLGPQIIVFFVLCTFFDSSHEKRGDPRTTSWHVPVIHSISLGRIVLRSIPQDSESQYKHWSIHAFKAAITCVQMPFIVYFW